VGWKLPLFGVTALAAVAAAPAADARTADTVTPPPAWATINICDTTAHPDAVGVRGRMRGTGDARVALRMRFRLQYRRSGEWVQVPHADSHWVAAGAGDQRYAEAGHTFTVTRPGPHQAFVFRGYVTFQWVDVDGLVVQSTRRVTRGGHPGTMGADPATASAATCAVR
jgi:hypothetical protein